MPPKDYNKSIALPTPTIEEFLASKTSMLRDDIRLPYSYARIEDRHEAEAAAYPKTKRQVRIHIVWDNDLDSLDLLSVLEKMRETGAAMVVKVEPIS